MIWVSIFLDFGLAPLQVDIDVGSWTMIDVLLVFRTPCFEFAYIYFIHITYQIVIYIYF